MLGVCLAFNLGGGVPLAIAQTSVLPVACRDAAGLDGKGDAVIAVLSPRMVYSLTEWPRLRRLAMNDGLRVIAWRSSEIGETEWRAALDRAGWTAEEADAVAQVPVACAAWVARPNHFPYTWVVAPGGAVSWPIAGVLPDAAWLASLRLRRGMLAQVGEEGRP